MVTQQLQVERRTAKERWPETDVVSLSHADQLLIVTNKKNKKCFMTLLHGNQCKVVTDSLLFHLAKTTLLLEPMVCKHQRDIYIYERY